MKYLRNWWKRKITYDELNKLSDRELSDVGLNRSTLCEYVRSM